MIMCYFEKVSLQDSMMLKHPYQVCGVVASYLLSNSTRPPSWIQNDVLKSLLKGET